VVQCVAVCCSVLQCVAVCCSVLLQCEAVCCRSCLFTPDLQIQVCCSISQCVVAVCDSVLQFLFPPTASTAPGVLQCAALNYCSVLQCIAVCCSV